MLNIPKHDLDEINIFINGLKYPIVVYGNADQHEIIEKISETIPYHVNTIARYCRNNKIRFQELRTMCK